MRSARTLHYMFSHTYSMRAELGLTPDAQTRTQLFEEARVLLSPGRQVFLCKL